MGKIVETRKRYKETINEITKSEENWIKFLDSSSWNFKYDFIDQVLIYTQKPEAKACASMDIWNKKLHRWVNKNADVIFVLSKDDNNAYPFDIVFDVTDTHNYKGTEYKLWSVKQEYEEKVIETLEATFGGESCNTLAEQIISSSYSMVMDNIQDYLPTIHENKNGTGLENLTDNEIQDSMVLTVHASVAYMMMTRCGINAMEHISEQEFMLVKKFNSDKIITTLGTTIGDIAEMGLKEIAKTITNLQKLERNINRTFAENKKQEYSNGIEKVEGGNEYGENRIHEDKRLQYTEFSNGEREDTEWQIRQNETEISKRKQKSILFNTIDGQKLERRINESTRTSNRNDKQNNREISETGRDNRRNESTRSDGMDRGNEQLQDDSRGASNQGTNIQLDLLLTENEQKQKITEVQDTSVFSLPQNKEDISLEEKLYKFYNNYDIYDVDEVSMEQVKADLKDNESINETLNYLKEIYEAEDEPLKEEFETEILEIIIELEKLLPEETKDKKEEYIYSIGDNVFLGTTEYQITAINGDTVSIADVSFPVLVEQLDFQEFNKRVRENPINDNLKERQRAEDTVEDIVEENDDEDIKETEIREKEIKELKNFIGRKVKNGEITYTIVGVEPIDDINEGEDLFNLQDDNTKEYTIEPVGFVKYLIKIEQGITNVDTNIEEIKEDKQENELKAKVKTRRKNKIEYFDLHPEIPLEDRHNFKIQNEDLGAGGKKEKYRNNVQAIRVLKQCENENRYATPEEQEILSKYVGWGGIPEVFDTRNDNWDAEYNELKSLLTEKEYEEARRSTLTAFYTPPIVIKSIYKALENMGLKRGNILEPSCRCTVISLE